MQKSKPPVKWLNFKLTPKEYSDFWYIASLLGESKKKPALLEMLKKIKELYGP